MPLSSIAVCHGDVLLIKKKQNVDPESALRKFIGARSLEKFSKVRFSFLGSHEAFSLRRKETYDQPTSEMKSTHKVGLENKV